MNKLVTYKHLEHNGRLGNQLYQLVWMLYHRNTHTVCIKPDWTYRPYFSVPDEYFQHPASEDILDGGTEYYQDLKWFTGLDMSWFAPSEKARIVLDAQQAILDDEDGFDGDQISLHVRRGDYLKYPNHFPFPTQMFYTESVEYMRYQFKNPVFNVFSDDLQWCRYNKYYLGFNNDDKVRFIGFNEPTPVEVADRIAEPTDQYDMFLMANCDGHILSNGTFSVWGAYLSGSKIVTVPSVWYGPELAHIDHKLMIPKDWQTITC